MNDLSTLKAQKSSQPVVVRSRCCTALCRQPLGVFNKITLLEVLVIFFNLVELELKVLSLQSVS